MRKSLFYLFILFTLLFSTDIYAQNKPMVAVLPFSPVGVSDAEAHILTGLFETALVNTGAFYVIEQTQAGEILGAQEYSLGGCTDEACAVEIGKLLAAENIILGTVSKLGAKFIVTAKIIDVTSGKNIRADTVEGMAIEDMTEKVNILAYRLTDIVSAVPIGSGEVSSVTSLTSGELFINTVPSGAAILIDGINKGTSPTLISGLSPGAVLVEVRKNDTFASKEVTVIADQLTELSLELQSMAGHIFILTDDKSLQVYLDGVSKGNISDGLLKDVGTGEHTIELKSPDRYWKGTVLVEIGKTVRVEAKPVGFGTTVYELPEGANAVIIGTFSEEKVSGSGEIKLPADKYNVVISGDYYEILRTGFSVREGIKTEFRPELEFADTVEAAAFLAKIRITELEKKRRNLKKEIRMTRGNSTWQTVGWISAGVGAAGALTALGSIIWGIAAKSAYNNTADSFEALGYREAVEGCEIGLMIGGGSTLLFGGAGVPLILLTGEPTPDDDVRREELQNELVAVELELEQLRKTARGGK